VKVKITKRGATWRLHKRVPPAYLSVAGRAHVTFSLQTDSQSIAQLKADAIWHDLLAEWDVALDLEKVPAAQRVEAAFERAKMDAQRLGFRYIPASEVATLPLPEVLARVETVIQARPGVSQETANAALGLVEKPRLMLSDALDRYTELVSAEALSGKTLDQVRKWTNPKLKATRELIGAVGDKPVAEIDHTDALKFRGWLLTRVQRGEIKFESARKTQSIAIGVLRKLNSLLGLGCDFSFAGLSIKANAAEVQQRVSVPADWVRSRWLVRECEDLDGLNDEARNILLMLVNTGARPSEVSGLKLKHIELSGPVPLIRIEPDGRELKNAHSRRTIPLAGVSLLAAREAIQTARKRGSGTSDWLFPRYALGDTLSATLNKYLRSRDLLPAGATVYGIRHGFEDRMLTAGTDERVRSDVFGHSLQRQRYGDGGGDSMRLIAVQSVAL
jgi:site-specific recombinase XerC